MVHSTPWFRRVVLRQVAVATGATWLVTALCTSLVIAATGRDETVAIAVGATAATLVVAMRVVVALVLQPTGVRYQRRHRAHVPDLAAAVDPVDLDDTPPAVAHAVATLEALGFDDVATVVDRASGSVPVLRVLAARDGLVVASVALPSGTVTVHSGLVEADSAANDAPAPAVLVTTSSLVVPSDGLVVDLVSGADVVTLVSRHAKVLRLMFERRLCVGDPVELVTTALRLERDGLTALGSVVGALVRFDDTRHRVAVGGSPSADALLVQTSLSSLSTTRPSNAVVTAPTPERVVEPLLLWEAPPSVGARGEPRRLQPTVV